jgi:hypothetical protein
MLRTSHRLAACGAVLVVGLIATGCSETGSGGGSKSESNTDHSAALVQSIETGGPSQLAKNLANATGQPESSFNVTLRQVSCTRSGNTQTYDCLATENETNSSDPEANITDQRLTITGTCDNNGNCDWHSS